MGTRPKKAPGRPVCLSQMTGGVAVAVGDFDGDQIVDVAVSQADTLDVYYGDAVPAGGVDGRLVKRFFFAAPASASPSPPRPAPSRTQRPRPRPSSWWRPGLRAAGSLGLPGLHSRCTGFAVLLSTDGPGAPQAVLHRQGARSTCAGGSASTASTRSRSRAAAGTDVAWPAEVGLSWRGAGRRAGRAPPAGAQAGDPPHGLDAGQGVNGPAPRKADRADPHRRRQSRPEPRAGHRPGLPPRGARRSVARRAASASTSPCASSLAFLTVTTREGADVAIDGRTAATTPLTRPIEIAPGAHFVAVTHRGYRAYAQDVDIARGEARTLDAPLEVTHQRVASLALIARGRPGHRRHAGRRRRRPSRATPRSRPAAHEPGWRSPAPGPILAQYNGHFTCRSPHRG